jgi:uncharacterized membrane protein YgcG
MDEIILTSLLYLIIICFLGHLIINYCLKSSIREGARTLPRPVIHPELNEPLYKFKPSPPYYGETLDQMIDRYINMYFDKRGLPYMNTIQLYVDNCVNKGNVTEENKSKLNDIGYYFLNIVIPNIQSVKNPVPEQNWPAIKWSGMNTFKVSIQPTPTYLIYKGQPYKDSYFSRYHSSMAENGGQIDPTGGSSSGGSSGTRGGGGGGSSGDSGSEICDSDDLGSCGIGCPSSCLDGIAASWYKQQQDESSSSKDGKDGSSSSNNTDGSQWDDKNRSNIGNTQRLPGGNNNTLIIGSAEIDGYVITDEEQTSSETTLNDKIDAFIKEFFIEKGPNKNRPTQKAIDVFNMYFQYRKPMDDIHMNKMRDVVYYILQVILPGLPTSSLPRSYVEWRPIVWLSLSERTKR